MERVHVFFYGLFMDEALLRARDLDPGNAGVASLDDFALRIGNRATLVPTSGSRAYGVVYTLKVAELEQLYADPSVQAYRPQPVRVRLANGGTISALCYNLPDAPSPHERNPEYAAKLRALAQRLGLPSAYIDSIG